MKSKWQEPGNFNRDQELCYVLLMDFFQFYFFAFEVSDPIQSLFSDEKKCQQKGHADKYGRT